MPSTPTAPHYLPLLLAVWLTPLPPDRSPSSPKGSQGYLPFPPYSPGSHWHLSHVFGTWWQYLTILGTVSCLYGRTLFYMAVFFKALHVHNTVQKVGPNSVTRGEASNLFLTKEALSFCHLWLILKLQTVLGTPRTPPQRVFIKSSTSFQAQNHRLLTYRMLVLKQEEFVFRKQRKK